MSLDADKIYNKLLSAGEDWADKQAASSLLEETKKSVLSKLMAQGDGSVAAREMAALCHPDYEDHIERMIEAGRLRDRARVLYNSLQALMELRRSQESTKRAEMQIK